MVGSQAAGTGARCPTPSASATASGPKTWPGRPPPPGPRSTATWAPRPPPCPNWWTNWGHAPSATGYLREAYEEAEEFCRLLQQRVKGAGFFKTLLLRRLGSSMGAGRKTVTKLLGSAPDELSDEDDDDVDDDDDGNGAQANHVASDFKDFTPAEVKSLNRCLALLRQGGNNAPKLDALVGYLLGTRSDVAQPWIDRGCILFSQYYDTVRWVGDELAQRAEFAGLEIGLYVGSKRSGLWSGGRFQRCEREVLKTRVRAGAQRGLDCQSAVSRISRGQGAPGAGRPAGIDPPTLRPDPRHAGRRVGEDRTGQRAGSTPTDRPHGMQHGPSAARAEPADKGNCRSGRQAYW